MVFLLLTFAPLDGLQRIALRNQYAVQAQQAYDQKKYQQAAALYEKVRNFEGKDVGPSIQLNLAHSYFHVRQFSQASPIYRALLKSTSDFQIKSVIAGQLSVIEAEEGNYTKALALSKQALVYDELNQQARYNYELLQKYLILHPEKNKLPPPNRQRNPQAGQTGGAPQTSPGSGTSQANTAGANGLGGPGSQPSGTAPQPANQGNSQNQNQGNSPGNAQGTDRNGQNPNNPGSGNRGNQEANQNDAFLQTRYERLQKLKLSPEKARQLLDAMRQEETQYIQQIPRRRTKKQNPTGPDW